ncbi:MAG: hypothetical protein GF364_20125 [Candidatus Lokiarchaeota archaeon]|nr:hypothetical protein [Candidatus Lokiarchaeota archaeon]
MGKQLALYKKHHIDKDYEELGLFKKLNEEYIINEVFYPGSYAHITPALVFPKVIFNDLYQKLIEFYNSEEIKNYIESHKLYSKNPIYLYIKGDYTKKLPLEEETFDLLISQYAGFVSRACRKYLKIGGILVANNSHGDAGMANYLPEYDFIAVMNRRKTHFSHSTKNLDAYFIPKKPHEISEDYLEQIGKGIGYTKYATDYVFRRLK